VILQVAGSSHLVQREALSVHRFLHRVHFVLDGNDRSVLDMNSTVSQETDQFNL
jgi:hypothetical protein